MQDLFKYFWDKNTSYSYDDFLSDMKEDIIEQADNWDNPVYEHYNSPEEARNSTLSLGVGLVLPSPVLKRLTAASNAAKPVNNLAEGFTIPNGYNYLSGGQNIFVSPHAFKHLLEMRVGALNRLGPKYFNLLGQVYQKALHSTIDDIVARGPIQYNIPYFSGGNKIIFGAPRVAGELPAVKHFSTY